MISPTVRSDIVTYIIPSVEVSTLVQQHHERQGMALKSSHVHWCGTSLSSYGEEAVLEVCLLHNRGVI
jgi:hypothetical protein